jgi:hypothetical protein
VQTLAYQHGAANEQGLRAWLGLELLLADHLHEQNTSTVSPETGSRVLKIPLPPMGPVGVRFLSATSQLCCVVHERASDKSMGHCLASFYVPYFSELTPSK